MVQCTTISMPPGPRTPPWAWPDKDARLGATHNQLAATHHLRDNG